MAKSKRFFQKSIFICVVMAFMAMTGSVWGEEATPATPGTSAAPAETATPVQKQKLDKINDLMAQLSAEGLTEQQKTDILGEILRLAGELAEEAKMTGNTALAGEVLNTVSKVTDTLAAVIQASPSDMKIIGGVADLSKIAAQITQTVADTAKAAGNTELAGQALNVVSSMTDNMSGIIQAGSADVKVLSAVADLSKTAAQITQTVAETAKQTGNEDLGERTIAVTGDIKTVTAQITGAANDIIVTGTDDKSVKAAETLIEEVRGINGIVQNAVDLSVQSGASPPVSENAPKAGTDPTQTGDVPLDEPVGDSNPASPN